jgi:replicative DNA helicase
LGKMQEFVHIPDTRDKETASLKMPPHSIEAEISVLGGLLTDNNAWDKVAEQISAEDFYRKDHKLIFQAISTLEGEGKPFDVVTVSEWLDNHNKLQDAGGLPFLATLAENTAGASNITAYANIVRQRSIFRKLISASNQISETVFNPQGRTSDEILDFAEQTIFGIAEQEEKVRKNYSSIKELLTRAIDRIDELFRRDNPITGISTGFNDFDERTAGLQSSDLIIIAGRPSMGKTAFAINIAEHAAIKNKLSVAVFSMEMPSEQLAMRILGSLSRINQQKIRTGQLNDDDWPRLTSTIAMMQDIKLYIDDTPALTPVELRSRSRRIAREKGGLDLIIVDYLQLMQVPGTVENRATEISEISRSLKAMAKELKVPVVALSQLNRSLESRTDKRPVMSDLRESGAIEQDADVIVFIYRDEVYHEDSPHKGVAEIIISKQRNGPIGTVRLTFLGQYTRFENYIEDKPYMTGYDE